MTARLSPKINGKPFFFGQDRLSLGLGKITPVNPFGFKRTV